MLRSVVWRRDEKYLAGVYNLVIPSSDKALCLLHVRRSVAGKAIEAGPGQIVIERAGPKHSGPQPR